MRGIDGVIVTTKDGKIKEIEGAVIISKIQPESKILR
jgi:hypothetical protein